ncbi:hypothetical protein ABPG77_010621 [Micractinium sp. CCAP 211/92]
MEGVETAFSAAQALLERTSVQELCKASQKIVLLEHNQTIGDALKSLSKSQILSAPMVIAPDIEEVAGGGEMSPQLLGWVDVADILRAFLQRRRAQAAHPDAGADEPAGEGGTRVQRPAAGDDPGCAAPRCPRRAAPPGTLRCPAPWARTRCPAAGAGPGLVVRSPPGWARPCNLQFRACAPPLHGHASCLVVGPGPGPVQPAGPASADHVRQQPSYRAYPPFPALCTGVEDRGLVFQAEGASTSLMDAVRNVFLRPLDGETKVVHRLAVFDAHGDIINVVSQTDIMRFLLSHIDELGGVADKSLEQLGMLTGKPPVLSVNPHVPALLAYAQLASQQVSGAPVVTDSGELIANLSISDIRAITAEQFGALALPVAEFLAVEHGTAYLGYSASTSEHARHPFFASANRAGGPTKGDIQLFTVKKDTTLREMLHKIVEEHIHRVYVVDKDDEPRVQAVITPTDVLRLVSGVY